MAVDIGKAKKVLNQAFLDNVSDISEDEAANLIVRSEQKLRDLRNEMANDEDLLGAQQVVKDLKGAYTSALKYEEAKISHLLEKIDEIQSGEVNPEASV
jgi:triosephosphate isomerase